MPLEVWTIGHSNHPLATFLGLLQESGIERLADVRRFPASRAHPHFNQEPLERALEDCSIAYRHFPDLGGRRNKRLPDSPNKAWRVEAFNAYADHIQSTEFQAAWQQLLNFASERRLALMCAEALPWRCHRRLIADLFVARGWEVWDIMPSGKSKQHELPAYARVAGEQVTYPGETLF